MTTDHPMTAKNISKAWVASVLVVMLPATGWAALGKLGAMGDSLSDEYWDSGVSTYATNWTSLLVMFRGIDMGPTAAQAGTNSWGAPRNLGYKYNWALSGATSASLLTQGQHTGLASQFSSDGVPTRCWRLVRMISIRLLQLISTFITDCGARARFRVT